MAKVISYSLLLILMTVTSGASAQSKSFRVDRVAFSTQDYDEFSPSYYKEGLVFCSNLKNNTLINYRQQNKNLSSVFYTMPKDSLEWKPVKLWAEELTSHFNDGPVSFNREQNQVYFSRNNVLKVQTKNLADSSNTLGIYISEFKEGRWTTPQVFAHSDKRYNYFSPALSSDGKRLYFASDKPGGYGGTDLYYCEWTQQQWSDPVNIGPAVNTALNEVFPFVDPSNKLFFASDGHGGLGKKDIFYTQQVNGQWIAPIHLDAEINSPHDDFGLISDSSFSSGYFSSNRLGSDDIFHFQVNPINFEHCDSILPNNYCYAFSDEQQDTYNDSIPVDYVWDFGNGIIKKGVKVYHCFPGPGHYMVKLQIRDSLQTDSIMGQSSYEFTLEEIKQVYIDAPNAALTGQEINLSILRNTIPGFVNEDYLWNLGEGFTIRGPTTSRIYTTQGTYTIKLGLLGKADSSGNRQKVCVYKKIQLFDDFQALATKTARTLDYWARYYPDAMKKEADETTQQPNPESNDGRIILPAWYYLLEGLSDTQQTQLFQKLYPLSNWPLQLNGTSIDTTSQLILSKIVDVLKQNTDIELFIAIHTTNKGFAGINQVLSESWVDSLSGYFNQFPLVREQIKYKGYGESRPITNSGIEHDSKVHQRIEFIFGNTLTK
ncbi:MAG: PKD domain-containing protein [Salinivirgaceae bacterium]